MKMGPFKKRSGEMHDSSASEVADTKDRLLQNGPIDRDLGYRLRRA